MSIREAEPSGRYWNSDVFKNIIFLDSGPEIFRVHPVEDLLKFTLMAQSGFYVFLDHSELRIGNASGAFLSLFSPSDIKKPYVFPAPSDTDSFINIADDAHRSLARRSANEIRESEGINSVKSILMRRKMPMSSTNKIVSFAKLLGLLRKTQVPPARRPNPNLTENNSISIMNSILQPNNKIPRSTSFEFAIDPIQESDKTQIHLITAEALQIKRHLSWHNSDIIRQINDLAKLDANESFIDIPIALEQIFRE